MNIMADEACRACRYWRHSGEKRKTATRGFCNQWAPYNYWAKRGPRSPRFIAGIGNGIFTAADDWCAKFAERGEVRL